MRESEIKLDFSNNTVIWYETEISFHARKYFSNNELIKKVISNEPIAIAEAYNVQVQRTVYVDSAKKHAENNIPKLCRE